MLAYEFMQRTLFAGFLLSILIPLIGVVMVNRRTSMLGDALSHTSLAGVGLGLILGLNPIVGAIVICLISAFSIEAIRKRFPYYGDMATAVIMSTGLGFAAILSDYAPGGNSFEAYLFGSISSVSPTDVWLVGVLFIPVFLISVVYYAGLLYVAVDANLARLAGVKVRLLNGVFTALTAITIAMAVKVVGALLVASLIALPVATALFISQSYRQTVWISVILGVIYTMSGLTVSFYQDVKPGGAIVLFAVVGMILFAILAKLRVLRNRRLGKEVKTSRPPDIHVC